MDCPHGLAGHDWDTLHIGVGRGEGASAIGCRLRHVLQGVYIVYFHWCTSGRCLRRAVWIGTAIPPKAPFIIWYKAYLCI